MALFIPLEDSQHTQQTKTELSRSQLPRPRLLQWLLFITLFMILSLLLSQNVNIPRILSRINMVKTAVCENNATQSSHSNIREDLTTGNSTDIAQPWGQNTSMTQSYINFSVPTTSHFKVLTTTSDFKVPADTAQTHLDGHCWGAEIGKPIITFEPLGRLGNRISEYAYLFIVHKTYNVSAAIHPRMLSWFQDMFAKLSLKLIGKQCLDELQNTRTDFLEVWKTLPITGIKKSVMFTGTPCHALHLWSNRQLWREELQLSQRIKDLSALRVKKMISGWRMLHNTSSSATEQLTTVGVHVRRREYAQLLRIHKAPRMAPPSYYHEAFQYYRDRFGKVIFLVVTEPKLWSWCESYLMKDNKDVIVVNDGGSPVEDISLLGTLSHIIYSHGSFGLWGIFLGHTQTVVYPNQTVGENMNKYWLHKNIDKIRLSSSEIEFISIHVGVE